MPKLHLGTIGYSYDFWKGTFYPHKLGSKNFLAYYSTQFNTVEVDSTFYRIPSVQTVENWRAQTPHRFLFSLKFPRRITHLKALKDTDSDTSVFLRRAELLGEKLGPMLLQFPPHFTATHMPDLAAYLQKLPKQHRYVIEVRHKSWLTPEFYSLLRENRVALAWVETPLLDGVAEVTGDFLYMRWEGDRSRVNGLLGKVEVDRSADLAVWSQKIKSQLDNGLEIFGYFGKYFSGLPPHDVNNLSNLMGSSGSLFSHF